MEPSSNRKPGPSCKAKLDDIDFPLLSNQLDASNFQSIISSSTESERTSTSLPDLSDMAAASVMWGSNCSKSHPRVEVKVNDLGCRARAVFRAWTQPQTVQQGVCGHVYPWTRTSVRPKSYSPRAGPFRSKNTGLAPRQDEARRARPETAAQPMHEGERLEKEEDGDLGWVCRKRERGRELVVHQVQGFG
eukprot:501770-Hanusia_phi.AAC.2